MVNQKDQIIKISLASLKHLIDAVRYVAQMYKIELTAHLKSPSLSLREAILGKNALKIR